MKTTNAKSTKNSNTKTEKQNGYKAKSGAAEGLRELFVDELKDIFWAEKALTKAIPKMIKNSNSKELETALTDHLEITQEHIVRLEKVFTAIGKKAVAKKCEAMDGLIKEAEEIMKNTEKGMVRDAAIILASQKVEHYEIASYGTLCAFAKTLGEDKVASILHETLEEEKEADTKLTDIAESFINEEAASI